MSTAFQEETGLSGLQHPPSDVGVLGDGRSMAPLMRSIVALRSVRRVSRSANIQAPIPLRLEPDDRAKRDRLVEAGEDAVAELVARSCS